MTDESNDAQLREPLLVEREPSTSEAILKRRGSNASSAPGNDIEQMEIEERPEEDARVGECDLRCLWILFQYVWPALLMSGGWVNSYGEWIVSVSVPSLGFPFFLAICADACNNNIRFKFSWKDIIPTVMWILLPLVEVFLGGAGMFLMSPFLAVVCGAFVLPKCFKHGPFGVVRIGCNCMYYNFIVRPSNRFNFFKSLEDDFFEQLQEQEAAEQESLEAQNERLSYLEELAPTHQRKTPICMIVMLVTLGTCALAFLLYAALVLLTDPMVKTPVDTYYKDV